MSRLRGKLEVWNGELDFFFQFSRQRIPNMTPKNKIIMQTPYLKHSKHHALQALQVIKSTCNILLILDRDTLRLGGVHICQILLSAWWFRAREVCYVPYGLPCRHPLVLMLTRTCYFLARSR